MKKRLDPGHVINFIQSRELNLTTVPKTSVLEDFQLGRVKKLYRKNLFQHYGCVNAIEFSGDGSLLASAGDDRRVLLWDVHKTIHGREKSAPITMQAEHRSNVFVVAIDSTNSKIFSGGNDDQVIVHDVATGKPLDYFLHDAPIYGISIDPLNDNLFATACDNGQLQIYDTRDAAPFCLTSATSAYQSVMFNPQEPRLLVSANVKTGVALWDVRMPNAALLNYGGKNSEQCCMSARFSQDGSKIIALRRRLPPILFATHSTNHLFQFNHAGYYNSCTMKSCSFAGSNDQFVVSGSDNFDLYMWKIPAEESPENTDNRLVHTAQLIFCGHRSVVNQVRYNPKYSIIASSGVEKLIKFWSPFPLPFPNARSAFETFGSYDRRIFSNNDYVNLILQSGQFLSLTYDTNRRTTREDPRMLAFFDALVQRDIAGLSDQEDELSLSSNHPETLAHNVSSWAVDHPLLPNDENTAGENSGNVADDSGSGSDDEDMTDDVIGLDAGGDDILIDIDQSSSEGNNAGGATNDTAATPSEGELSGKTSHDSKELSKGSTSRDEEEGPSQSPEPDKMKNNVITKLIAQKHLKLIRMARNQMRLEAEGKPKLKRRHMTLLDRLKRLNRKTHSLTMNLLPFPEPTSLSPVSSPPASDTNSADTSSSSSDTSTSSSSSSDSDDDFLELRKKVKPLLIDASTSTTALPQDPASEEETQKPTTSAATEGRRGTSTSQRTERYLVRKKKQHPPQLPREVGNIDDEPCTSATALRRLGIAPKTASRKRSKETKEQEKTSSSSTSSDTSDHTDFITRLEEVSKRLKRVTHDLTSSSSILRNNGYNPKRKQQSTMIRSPTSSSLSSTFSSSTSSSEDIVHKLPPAPKRRKLSSRKDDKEKRPVKQEAEAGASAEKEETSNSSREKILGKRRPESAKYRDPRKSSEDESD